MPLSAQDPINRCRFELIDPSPYTYWSDVELLAWENSAIGATVQLDGSASVVNLAFQLAAGTMQLLPADALRLLTESDRFSNLGTNGTTPGSAITVTDLSDMNACRRNWRQDPVSPNVRNIMANPQDPRRFDNWPPSDGTNYINLPYQQIPDNIGQVVKTTSGATSSGAILTMADTSGVAIGMLAQDLTAFFVASPAQPTYPIVQGAKVLSVVANTSVTLDTNVYSTVNSGDLVSFSNLFPLPDAYEEPVFNFMMAHALNKQSSKIDPQRSAMYWGRFLSLLATDDQQLQALKIGTPSY